MRKIRRRHFAYHGDFLIRVLVGLIFLVDGYGKFFGKINFASILAEQGLPFATYLAKPLAVLEMILGLMLAAGFLTYVAAPLLAIGLIFMISTLYIHTGGWNGLKYPLLLLVILLRYTGTRGYYSVIDLIKKFF